MRLIETEFSKGGAGHYSPGVLSNGTLYISGQLSLDPRTKERPAGFALEVERALENMLLVLNAAGLAREHVVLCRVYISDMANWDELNRVYAAWFGAHRPARVVVPCGELHFGCAVEIEAVAEAGARA